MREAPKNWRLWIRTNWWMVAVGRLGAGGGPRVGKEMVKEGTRC